MVRTAGLRFFLLKEVLRSASTLPVTRKHWELATGRSGAYPDGTFTRESGVAFKTHHNTTLSDIAPALRSFSAAGRDAMSDKVCYVEARGYPPKADGAPLLSLGVCGLLSGFGFEFGEFFVVVGLCPIGHSVYFFLQMLDGFIVITRGFINPR